MLARELSSCKWPYALAALMLTISAHRETAAPGSQTELSHIRSQVSSLRVEVQCAEALRAQFSSIQSRLNNVRAAPRSAEEEELLRLRSDTDAVLESLHDSDFPAL